jgi:hypothetical protein
MSGIGRFETILSLMEKSWERMKAQDDCTIERSQDLLQTWTGRLCSSITTTMSRPGHSETKAFSQLSGRRRACKEILIQRRRHWQGSSLELLTYDCDGGVGKREREIYAKKSRYPRQNIEARSTSLLPKKFSSLGTLDLAMTHLLCFVFVLVGRCRAASPGTQVINHSGIRTTPAPL